MNLSLIPTLLQRLFVLRQYYIISSFDDMLTHRRNEHWLDVKNIFALACPRSYKNSPHISADETHIDYLVLVFGKKKKKKISREIT